VKTKLQLN